MALGSGGVLELMTTEIEEEVERSNLRAESVCEWHLLARGRGRKAILRAWRFYPRDALDPRDDIHNSRVFWKELSC